MSTPLPTIVELSGHIIDSLTLAKVIDLIQTHDCRYQINDLQIGEKKNDLSYVQISIWINDDAKKDELIAELKTYGAHPIGSKDITLASCPEDGKLPLNAYIRKNPPTELHLHKQWIAVEREGADHVIVVDEKTSRAKLVAASDVKKGEQVVVGTTGVKILPSL